MHKQIRHSGAARRPGQRRALAAVAVTAIVLSGVAACTTSSDGSGGGGGTASKTVDLRLLSDIDTLNPQQAKSISGFLASLFLYDRLVELDGNNQVKPALATSWNVTPEGGTFQLRSGVTCSDGTKLTATDVAKSFQLLLDPKTAAPHLGDVFGPAKHVVVTADDQQNTVTFKLDKPDSDLLTGLAFPAASVICPSGVANPSSLTAKPDGTGPFVLTSAQKGVSYKLAAHSGYSWGVDGSPSDPGFPQHVDLQVVADDSTASNLLITGKLNVGPVTGLNIARVKAQLPKATVLDTTEEVVSLVFKESAGHITSDPIVRQALAMSLDRDAYAHAMTDGIGATAQSYIAPTTQCYSASLKDSIQSFNVAAARALLLSHGWTSGAGGKLSKDGKPLAVTVVDSPNDTPGTDYLIDAWGKLGATVKLNNVDYSTYIQNIFGDGYDATPLPLAAAIAPSPAQATAYFVGGKGSINVTGNEHTDTQAAMSRAYAATGDARCTAWQDAQKSLLDSSSVVPIAQVPQAWIGDGVSFKPTQKGLISPTSLRVN